MATLKVCDICGCNTKHNRWIDANVGGFPLPKDQQEQNDPAEQLISFSSLFSFSPIKKMHKEFSYEICLSCGLRLVSLLELLKQNYLKEDSSIEYLKQIPQKDNPWLKVLKQSTKKNDKQ